MDSLFSLPDMSQCCDNQRLRMGHTMFTHSHLLSFKPSPICNFCHTPLTVFHILMTCPSYASIQSRFTRLKIYLTTLNIYPLIIYILLHTLNCIIPYDSLSSLQPNLLYFTFFIYSFSKPIKFNSRL